MADGREVDHLCAACGVAVAVGDLVHHHNTSVNDLNATANLSECATELHTVRETVRWIYEHLRLLTDHEDINVQECVGAARKRCAEVLR